MSNPKKNLPGNLPSNSIGADKTVLRPGPPIALPLTETSLRADDMACGQTTRKKDPLIGVTFKDKYTIEEKLGEGGMAVVYKARFREVWNGQTVIDKPVAIKLMNPMPKGNDSDDAEARRRDEDNSWSISHFIREVNIATALEHENIVRVMDFIVTEDDRPGCVMELIKGSDLSGVIYDSESPMRLDRFVGIASQICSGLQYAHEKGIIHRDIKPANILVTQSGSMEIAKVNDFGLAKNRNASTHTTKVGDIFGTFEYAPPEQIMGETHDDPRMDVYAFGATMYEMLCRTPPFTNEGIVELQRAIVYDAPQEPKSLREDIPQEVNDIIMKCLEKDPAKRFQTMKEAKDALERFRKKAQIAPTRRINQADMAAISAKRKLPTPKKTETQKEPSQTPAESQGGTDTTMAMPIIPHHGSKKRWAIGALAAAIAVSAVIAGVTRRLDADPARHIQSQAVDAESREEVDKGTGTEPLAQLAKPRHKLTFRTEPDGVEVKAGEASCVTEARKGCTIELEEGSAPLEVTLRKTGFSRLARQIVPDSDKEIELSMKPLREPARAAAPKIAPPIQPVKEPKPVPAPESKKTPEKKPSITTEE